MKLTSLRRAVFALTLAFALPHAPVLAQDEEAPETEEPAEDEEPQEFDADEFKKRVEELGKAEKQAVDKMMQVFKPLVGEWTGKEKIEHTQDQFKPLDKAWDDVWSGVYTMDGRYFEMNGQTSGDNVSTYKWICTWDQDRETYIAWYFGDNTHTQYLTWRTKGNGGGITEFTMKADGDRVKCFGEDKDRAGDVFSTQRSSYTRKKLEL
jgi:hypothetical protein